MRRFEVRLLKRGVLKEVLVVTRCRERIGSWFASSPRPPGRLGRAMEESSRAEVDLAGETDAKPTCGDGERETIEPVSSPQTELEGDVVDVRSRKRSRKGTEESRLLEPSECALPKACLTLLTYNLWFDASGRSERMRAFGQLVDDLKPHIVCLQEVTREAYGVFKSMSWWNKYTGSYQALGVDPWPAKTYAEDLFVRSDAATNVSFDRTQFRTSLMGRELVTCTFTCTSDNIEKELRVVAGTCHLESPTPPHGFHVEERRRQMSCALETIERLADTSKSPIALLAGDFNWSERRFGKAQGDGEVDLPHTRWFDAWSELHPSDPGYTYNASENPALKGSLKGRLDRCLVRISEEAAWRPREINMIGKEVVPGAYRQMARARGRDEAPTFMPMCISDHFGLHITLEEI